MIEEYLSKAENEEIDQIIEDNLSDIRKYYFGNKARDAIRKLLHIPYRLGEFYHSQGKRDDYVRRAIDIMQTKENQPLVEYYRIKNHKRPKKCNMITSAPCTWSKTHWSNERCDKCGTVFPEWN